MATLCLPNAELHEGVVWSEEDLGRILGGDCRRPILLYPGDGAIDVSRHPPDEPVTLVVVDGTWWQARKIIRKNPRLAALPRYAFTPDVPSQYRIRKEPADTCVSTIEALVHVLGVLEGEPARLRPLLVPFARMIDVQIECERALRGGGRRHALHSLKKSAKATARRARVHPFFTGHPDRLVCVIGEANAWPYREREAGARYEDEIIHWVACRVGTGATFERIIRPEQPLAPRTPDHVRLDAETLGRGAPMRDAVRDWRDFLRDDDAVCAWGHYASALFLASGGAMPARRLDVRVASRDYGKARVGTLEEHAVRFGLASRKLSVSGRAGERLEAIDAIVRRFVALGSDA
jgi:hypothetical protein